jgi:hypothetical protein
MQLRTKIIAGAGALTLLAGGTAYAAIPDSDDGEFHACVSNTGSLKTILMIDKQAGTNCPSNYTEEVWNQQGPTGPQGPQGPAGEAGSFSGIRLERFQDELPCIETDPDNEPGVFSPRGYFDLPSGVRADEARGVDGNIEEFGVDGDGLLDVTRMRTELVSDEVTDGRRFPFASYRLDSEGRVDGVLIAAFNPITGSDEHAGALDVECDDANDTIPAELDVLVYDIEE